MSVTLTEAIANFSSVLLEAQRNPVVITDGDQELGAIVSMRDYRFICSVKAAVSAESGTARDEGSISPS